MESDVKILAGRILARQYLSREEPLVRRALTDEIFRQELDGRLESVGLRLVDNPYADHVSVALICALEQPVLGAGEVWTSNSLGLDRSAMALLVVLWALIILPKRQRQIERRRKGGDDAQTEMFVQDTPLPRSREVAPAVSRQTLIADFGDRLGRATRVKMNLGQLARLGFIVQRREDILEGPLLDLLFDYNLMADRILDGALGDLLGSRLAEAMPVRGAQEDEDV